MLKCGRQAVLRSQAVARHSDEKAALAAVQHESSRAGAAQTGELHARVIVLETEAEAYNSLEQKLVARVKAAEAAEAAAKGQAAVAVAARLASEARCAELAAELEASFGEGHAKVLELKEKLAAKTAEAEALAARALTHHPKETPVVRARRARGLPAPAAAAPGAAVAVVVSLAPAPPKYLGGLPSACFVEATGELQAAERFRNRRGGQGATVGHVSEVGKGVFTVKLDDDSEKTMTPAELDKWLPKSIVGTYFHKKSAQWAAQCNGEFLGYFCTQETAALERDKKLGPNAAGHAWHGSSKNSKSPHSDER